MTKQMIVSLLKTSIGVIVNEPDDVISVWHEHLSSFCSNKCDPKFDAMHFRHVTGEVRKWAMEKDHGQFLSEPFDVTDVSYGLRKLNRGKSAGYDGISSEHLQKLVYHCILYLPVFSIRSLNWSMYQKTLDTEHRSLCIRERIHVH